MCWCLLCCPCLVFKAYAFPCVVLTLLYCVCAYPYSFNLVITTFTLSILHVFIADIPVDNSVDNYC